MRHLLRMATATIITALWCPQAAAQTGERPGAALGPTEVRLAMLLVDLAAIDGSRQSVTADLYVWMQWSDPRLTNGSTEIRSVPLEGAWYPPLALVNQGDVSTDPPTALEVHPDGTVIYRQRSSGTFVSPMQLRDFPFDRQRIEFHLVMPGETPDDIRIVVDHERSGRLDTLSIPDWIAGPVRVEPRALSRPGAAVPISGATLGFEVTRRVGYYVGKAFASVAIIAAMGWLVFWIPVEFVAPRVSVSVTAMLTLVAYRFLLGSALPSVPYLTRMDWFLLGSTMLVFTGLVALVAGLRLGGARSGRLELVMRVAYPLAFIVLTLAVAFA